MSRFDRFMNGFLRFVAISVYMLGCWAGFSEEYANAAFLVGLGCFNLLLAQDK